MLDKNSKDSRLVKRQTLIILLNRDEMRSACFVLLGGEGEVFFFLISFFGHTARHASFPHQGWNCAPRIGGRES